MLYLFFFDIRVDTPRLCALFVPLVAIPPPVASSFSCPQLPCPHAPRCPVLVHLVASVSCLSLPASVFCLHGIALTSRFNTTTLGLPQPTLIQVRHLRGVRSTLGRLWTLSSTS